MATRYQGPDTVTQIDAILLRIPELTAELVTAVVRVPLLATELAFSIIAVPFVAAQVISGLLVHAAERLDGFVGGTLNTRPRNHVLGTIGSPESYRLGDSPEGWRPQAPAEQQRRDPVSDGIHSAA